MNMEKTEYSEMLAFKLQMPVNLPEESIQQLFSDTRLSFYFLELTLSMFNVWHDFHI
jgi:hypothetical protein